MDKFRLYIDETGTPHLQNVSDPNHRFLGLIGVIAKLEYVSSVLTPEMEALKRNHFPYDPDAPPIFHRNELVNKKYPFKALKNPNAEESFNRNLLEKLNSWEYIVVAIVIDKLTHLEQYRVWRYHPYHYCMAVLIERFVIYLEQASAVGDCMAESRGREDRKLKEAYAKLYRNGTDFMQASRIQQSLTSCQLKIKPKSNNISGLQLADMIAYPSKQGILIEKNLIADPGEIFGKKIVKILEDEKYYRNPRDGNIWGCGKKILP